MISTGKAALDITMADGPPLEREDQFAGKETVHVMCPRRLCAEGSAGSDNCMPPGAPPAT